MSITPKNWQTFQHYKDRAPAWIKLHKGLLTDYKFSCLPVASRALAPLLWLLASEYEEGKITAELEEVAFRVHLTHGELCDALKPLVDSGFFAVDSKPLARRKRGASLEKEKQGREEKEKNIVAFEDFKKSYPKRKGPNPWPPARKLFEAAIKSGVDPQAIVAAVRAGVGFDRDRIGTEFIPHARKWLHDRCWEDHHPPPTAGPPQAPPGTPTAEELREKYGKLSAVPTETDPGETDRDGADQREELRPEGIGLRPILRSI